MRTCLLAFLALTSLALTSRGQPVPGIDGTRLRAVLPSVEQWLGAPLVIFEETLLVPQPEPGEASLWNHAIYVPLSRMRAFRSPSEVAAFLSHAAAHNKLNHAELYAEKVQLFERIAILSPHFPQAMQTTMQANLRANLEKEAAPVAAEFLAKSDARQLQRLLEAIK